MDCASDGSITPGEAEPHHRLGSFPVPFSLTRRPRGSPVVHRSGQRKAADTLRVFVDTLNRSLSVIRFLTRPYMELFLVK
jgi:hypothetical protein